MQVKGTAVLTIPLFIRSKFGDQGYNKWLQTLSPEVQKIFSKEILAPVWYPLKEGLIEPTLRLCDAFYQGKMDGALEQGRFSAEHGLQGVYKFLIKFASPESLAAKASTIMPTYYQPSAMEIVEKGPNTVTVRMTRFDMPHTVIDHRIKGWMERALELSGAKSGKAQIKTSMSSGALQTDFVITWG